MVNWVIITTSLINSTVRGRDYETRKSEYITAIKKIIETFKDYKIVIVENNSLLKKFRVSVGLHKTFLDMFGVPVLYTRTNLIVTRNYGMKELLDIFECIRRFDIQDDDFIIKITGRYMLTDTSDFVKQVKQLEETKYDAIIRYGSYMDIPAPIVKQQNCVSGLIGLRCKYVKQIEIPNEDTFVEENWAKRIASLDDEKVCVLQMLGVYIRPEIKTTYFLV